MKKLSTLFLLLTAFMHADEVETLLESRISKVIAVLDNKDIGRDSKYEQIEQLVDPMFGYDLMAKLSLGREFWPYFNEEQRNTFIAKFTENLKKSYFSKIVDYEGEKIEFRESKSKKGKVFIETSLKTKTDTIPVIYKFYKNDEKWLIYDVEIKGVSLISSYRSQYVNFLRSNSPDKLLAEMDKSE